MSIVACVKVQDGIAFGCDSATQISGKDPQGNIGVLKVYENARKLFRFQELPVGILSYGLGNIGSRSIQTILREFDREFSPNKDDYEIKDIAQKLLDHTSNLYKDFFKNLPGKGAPILGLYIAGYSSKSHMGDEWEFRIPIDKEPRQVRPIEKTGASWRGVDNPFTRLYFGYDARAVDELHKAGIDQDKIKSVFGKYQAKVLYDGMPVKDAMNLVKFILRTTIGLNSFEIGAASCSEPIQIAIVDAIKGFKWVERPTLYEREE